ncbi:MAG: hypothetical protein GY702_00390 [Desulfobulbaceae bacterium]|nr:hypothetical protein [Desulfobulbaceae bacterium]
MKVLLYNPHLPDLNRDITNKILNNGGCNISEVYTYDEFREEFSSCLSGDTIVVFSLHDEEDVRFLESMKNDFVDIKLLVNSMAGMEKLQDRIFKLYPRIVTSTDSKACFGLLPDAIARMVQRTSDNGNNFS